MRALLAAAAGFVATLAAVLRSRAAPEVQAQTDAALPWIPEDHSMDAKTNIRAFLAMIRAAEGTADDNGYAALFGHTAARPRLFPYWDDHPRVATAFNDQQGRRLWTSAAGAYQFMARSPIPGGGSTKVDTWDVLKRRLSLPDFSPASQDLAAIELIREAGALGDVQAGRVQDAIRKVRRIWASLPGAGHNQPERSQAFALNAYTSAGGSLA